MISPPENDLMPLENKTYLSTSSLLIHKLGLFYKKVYKEQLIWESTILSRFSKSLCCDPQFGRMIV